MLQTTTEVGSAMRSGASIQITTRPLWRIRLARELPRYLLCAAAIAGLTASARFAIDPPKPAIASLGRALPPSDLAARGFASLFARRYLTWNAANPEAHREALEPFVGAGVEPNAGMQVPTIGEQHVQWAEVVQEREPRLEEHVYTVAAQTDTAGLLYLTVAVLRRADGSLVLAGYPAFVGSPATGPAVITDRQRREVSDQDLVTVVKRAMSNYIASSPAELEADLTPSARVSLPGAGLTLETVQRLEWATGPGAVTAVVQARGPHSGQYTLSYELDVAREAGRWEISAIQMNPDA